MKKHFLFVTLLCLIGGFFEMSYGQTPANPETRSKIHFSLSAGASQSYSKAAPTSYRVVSYESYVEPMTNRQFQVRYNTDYRREHVFSNKPGGFIEGNIHFPLNLQLVLKTGVGLQWDQFSYKNQTALVSMSEPLDTTLATFPSGERPNIVYKFVTEPGYIFDASRDINHKLLQLRIPLLLEYRTPINVSIEAGGFLQSLLWSQSSRYAINSRLEQENLPDGKLQYTYYYSTTIEKREPAPNLAGITGGWQVGLSYRLRQWALEASYAQSLLNAFEEEEPGSVLTDYYTHGANVKTSYIRLGLRYFL
jgi:hypothetical protein